MGLPISLACLLSPGVPALKAQEQASEVSTLCSSQGDGARAMPYPIWRYCNGLANCFLASRNRFRLLRRRC